MDKNIIENKSFEFAVRVVNLYKHLKFENKEYEISKQVLRSGTSIGANVAEAERAQTKADFYSKMSIALKEANETHYWLRLLHATGYLTNKEFASLETDIKELIALAMAICKTTQESKDI